MSDNITQAINILNDLQYQFDETKSSTEITFVILAQMAVRVNDLTAIPNKVQKLPMSKDVNPGNPARRWQQ